MPPAGFESTILRSERPQTHALDRAAAGIGTVLFAYSLFSDAVNGTDWKEWMVGWQEMMSWTRCVNMRSQPNLCALSGIVSRDWVKA
jgi:hypothetical protein